MVIIISRSLASQKMLEAVILLGDTDRSVLAVNIGTEAGIQGWKGPCFDQVLFPFIL